MCKDNICVYKRKYMCVRGECVCVHVKGPERIMPCTAPHSMVRWKQWAKQTENVSILDAFLNEGNFKVRLWVCPAYCPTVRYTNNYQRGHEVTFCSVKVHNKFNGLKIFSTGILLVTQGRAKSSREQTCRPGGSLPMAGRTICTQLITGGWWIHDNVSSESCVCVEMCLCLLTCVWECVFSRIYAFTV